MTEFGIQIEMAFGKFAICFSAIRNFLASKYLIELQRFWKITEKWLVRGMCGGSLEIGVYSRGLFNVTKLSNNPASQLVRKILCGIKNFYVRWLWLLWFFKLCSCLYKRFKFFSFIIPSFASSFVYCLESFILNPVNVDG